jgi:hypothetical protein
VDVEGGLRRASIAASLAALASAIVDWSDHE